MLFIGNPPRWWHYLIGALIIIIGFAGGILSCVSSLRDNIPEIQCVVPGTHEIELDENGTFTIFYEYDSVVDGKTYLTDEYLTGIQVTIKTLDKSNNVPTSTPSGTFSYGWGNRSGTSILQFTVDEPGTYILDGTSGSRYSSPDIVLAVGKIPILKPAMKTASFILAGLAIGLFLISRAFIERRMTVK